MDGSDHNSAISSASPSSINAGPSDASPSSSQVQEEEEENHQQGQNQQQQQTFVSYIPNMAIPFVHSSGVRADPWSCVVVLIAFWVFASLILIFGLYGSVNLQLSSNFSRTLQASSFFVNEIKVQELTGPKHGMMLYGFHSLPPLDVEITWSETHNTSLLACSHKEWIYFLNKGSEMNIMYTVKSQSSSTLSLVIAQGKESLINWIEDPSYPNITLSWNIIHGSGVIKQEIFESSNYYVAIGNLNPEEVEVQLNLKIKALLYNTTEAYYRCSLTHGPCRFKLLFMGANAAVLTSPGSELGTSNDDWYVKLSYEPRWISYLIGSGAMTAIVLMVFNICTKFQSTSGSQVGQVGSEQAPLLGQKDDDLSSWGSSYGSVSHDEEHDEDWLAVGSLVTKPLKDRENHNPRRLCVICFDAPRDCFFLPCGHCAACFSCGTRIVEEAGTCPICRQKMKKVRKIITV